MTATPGCDMGNILTYGIDPVNFTTLPSDQPVISDHLGLCINIGIMSALGWHYSPLGQLPVRKFYLNKQKTKLNYIRQVNDEIDTQKLE